MIMIGFCNYYTFCEKKAFLNLLNCCTCPSTQLYPLHHYVHITDDYLLKISLSFLPCLSLVSH